MASLTSSVMVNPTEYCSRRPGLASQSRNSCVPPPESARISTRRRAAFGSCASASLVAAMWSAAVLDPALPGRSMMASGSPDPSGPWSANTVSGWKPIGFLPRRRGLLLIRVRGHDGRVDVHRDQPAVRARRRGPGQLPGPLPRRGPRGPDRRQRGRRVRGQPRDQAGHHRVGGHRPEQPGSARSTPASARQSPPNATATARSVTIFPGSCTARGARHRPSPADSPRLQPGDPGGLGQQQRARVGHDPRSVIRHRDLRAAGCILHVKSAFG